MVTYNACSLAIRCTSARSSVVIPLEELGLCGLAGALGGIPDRDLVTMNKFVRRDWEPVLFSRSSSESMSLESDSMISPILWSSLDVYSDPISLIFLGSDEIVGWMLSHPHRLNVDNCESQIEFVSHHIHTQSRCMHVSSSCWEVD